MALHREDVVRAALDLLDEVGLERLTTRALTDRLGVQRGALYWHVRSKHELLGAMADTVVARAFTAIDTGDGEAAGWAERTTRFAHRLRQALLAHRDGARLVSGHLTPGTGTLETVEEGLARMRAEGLTLAQAATFGHAVTSYVIGFVLQEQAAHTGRARQAGAGDNAAATVDPERYPHLAEWQTGQPADPDHAFTAGLAFLTAGLSAQLP
ncbi:MULTISPECIES: TetR/AcrR family transcriptional regulator C-terminal domain-containing protein [Kitasatospora]|uniref:TetR/AcrR family transcriptional regulator C-terminal domain-containing protein n=1 Tax=Kitasatospora cathayae TaxID=3004092 RepID=A0ABY7QDY7_9ACTN|nr:TetR/AcrR family transcriptional regulator C-terminal domain-containing protein [Kitasatospora sp. HUAS 3-15]WBP90962.1 TetR/AcrR family transcriptional regulator C-terminal domain-containing protein [Kitasatospora sp. HUAS 3-15]